jgi:hypothetical protein
MSLRRVRRSEIEGRNVRLLHPELCLRPPTITDEALREAIRVKVNQGVNRRAISTLVYAFAAAHATDQAGMISRKPVEHIPHGERAAFWSALSRIR